MSALLLFPRVGTEPTLCPGIGKHLKMRFLKNRFLNQNLKSTFETEKLKSHELEVFKLFLRLT